MKIKNMQKFSIALLCGGPSLERGISLNSARSVLDHLGGDDIEIRPVYFDAHRRAYAISPAQLYSNTPADFDFKLQHAAKPLSTTALVRFLKRATLVFPAVHGVFGEDGELARFLEKHHIPFVGSSASAAKRAFDKFTANEYIRAHGFCALPSVVVKIYDSNHRSVVEKFFKKNQIKRAIVKPASGGSSIGVFSVATPQEALAKIAYLFSKRLDTRVVIEPFAEGVEFTTIIMQNRFGLPVALPPTEIETDYTKHQIFDFRRKYLPTRQVVWHCPPRFSDHTIETIQAQAEQLFALFGLRDYARFDGWVFPDGKIWFCDFNLISGMEQNSFLFQQAARVGMTHREVLSFIVKNACARYGLTFPQTNIDATLVLKRKEIRVLCGGITSERQVSLMSGTNVWLKLRGSKMYSPELYVRDGENSVWRVPYQLALNHTVEEVLENCRSYPTAKKRLDSFESRARLHLGMREEKNSADFFTPEKMSLVSFLKNTPFLFNALHGGSGENGDLQALCVKFGVRFNGSSVEPSRLCMDKVATSSRITELSIDGISAIRGQVIETHKMTNASLQEFRDYWSLAQKKLGTRSCIIKPAADGCSTGVVRLYTFQDLKKYFDLLRQQVVFIPKNTFRNQGEIVALPQSMPARFRLERFIETDVVRIKNKKLKHLSVSGWVELTIGVCGVRGQMKAFNPSLTVTEGEVLSVEEKFQGGTGINLTPPPSKIMKADVVERVKRLIEQVVNEVGIEGYARVDAFAHVRSGEVLVIEINTLPALTPSTVLFQQALAEAPALFPRPMLERFVTSASY